MTEHIRFVNNLETQEIVDLYAEASVAVVPSVYEGFGLPAGEAMSCGLPVVSTNGGALPEVVGDAGIIVPVKDSDAIAREVKKLLDDPDLREELGKKARERIVNLLSWEQAARQMSRLYHDIISEVDGDKI